MLEMDTGQGFFHFIGLLGILHWTAPGRGAKLLRRTRAPAKCKFFIWLVLHDRCWTAARRKRHGLQDDDACALCTQSSETVDHLLLTCPFSREVWFRSCANLDRSGGGAVASTIWFLLGLVVSYTETGPQVYQAWLWHFGRSHCMDPVEGKKRQNLWQKSAYNSRGLCANRGWDHCLVAGGL